MAKIKVKINSPEPPIETIHRYRDFDGLMGKYQKYYTSHGIRDMLYNDRRKLVYVVLIILFILLLLFADDIAAQHNISHHQAMANQVAGVMHFPLKFFS